MTAASEKSAVALRVEANVAQLRARNAMVAQIRGTQWGLGIDSRAARAVANYCLEMGLDPVRHVEVLGGRIYLTSEFYQERAAPLIRSGQVVPHEPEFINVDARLDALADDADAETAAWAKAEKVRRVKARIEHNAPEAAIATCVQRCTIAITGKTIVGVNWCGGGTRKKYASGGVLKDADPIGDLEPTKTSITRAGRRMWKQVADVIVEYGRQIKPIEARAQLINESLDEEVTEEVPAAPAVPKAIASPGYGEDAGPALDVQEMSREDSLALDARLAAEEHAHG